MKNLTRLLLSAFCVFFPMALPSSALADIAPPEQLPGSNPGSGSAVTQVRMQEELVSITVGPEVVSPEGLPALQSSPKTPTSLLLLAVVLAGVLGIFWISRRNM
jgi:hypothetical protein